MNLTQTVEQVMQQGKNLLRRHEVVQGVLDAELLLMHVLSFSRVQLFSRSKDEISKEDIDFYEQLLHKRVQGVPLQYLTHSQEFMSLPFYVDERVLIPRGDTELLVETVLDYGQKENMQVLMDIGTGSGCIPISLTYYMPSLRMIGVDISDQALEVARSNAAKNRMNEKIAWMSSDLFAAIPLECIGLLDGIISNPPYIPTKEIDTLMKEVREYEPFNALDGGADGLDFYRKLAKEGKRYIRNDGFLFLEIGYNQGETVKQLLKEHGYRDIHVRKDLESRDRVVLARV
jgi:release factor glutamine methyltransferase